ncbi:phosphodiester glycosidase family protein [Parachlamydia sp. AcF125]|uniref:phosphodiester glycosidase family protein n=1 Tax=Parachlamydia sp. AcF125 TaxID=2795736 RepID=UPI001BC912B0|nr:phosphodiester glycosidase family protein [Parachlamydia sp. AcF125]MBS4168209.1 hypothetical protein [Parachlamydia sp. AcF125]
MNKILLKLPCFFFCVCFFFSIFGVEKEVRQGLSYEHILTDVPQSIHILKVDASYFEIMPSRALDDGIGRETVSSLSSRHQAIAAINGGFFQIGGNFDGLPGGILKIREQWFSLPYKPRGAIGWTKNNHFVLIDQLLASCSVAIKGSTIQADGLNRQRKKGEKILYTSAFHRTTLTNPEGIELVVENNKIDKICSHRGSNSIPIKGVILSIGETEENFFISTFSKDDPVEVSFNILPQSSPCYTSSADWEKMDYIVGGTPILIRNGKIISDFSSEKTLETFLTNRHSRTSIGLLKDKRWVFVVVDGKQPGMSEGMTMNELAQFMAKLGCVEALNLDGGGSSTLVINKAVINQPRGDEDEGEGKSIERRVSDAILILERKAD